MGFNSGFKGLIMYDIVRGMTSETFFSTKFRLDSHSQFQSWLSFLHEVGHGYWHDPGTTTLWFALLNEYSIEKYCSIEEGAIIRRPCITQSKRETFQYSIQNRKKKKVAVTIQVFVGTKTGWFRGFCSYYIEKVEDEGKICSGNERGKGMSWHTRRFSTILLYLQHSPPF